MYINSCPLFHFCPQTSSRFVRASVTNTMQKNTRRVFPYVCIFMCISFSYKLIKQRSQREKYKCSCFFLFQDVWNEDLNGAVVQRLAQLLKSCSGFRNNLSLVSHVLQAHNPETCMLTGDLVWLWLDGVCVCTFSFIRKNVWFSPFGSSCPSHHPQWCWWAVPLNWPQAWVRVWKVVSLCLLMSWRCIHGDPTSGPKPAEVSSSPLDPVWQECQSYHVGQNRPT